MREQEVAGKILCFGNLQLDVLCRTVTELPPPGQLRAIESIDLVLSGNAGNVAMVLGRLGFSVELAGYSGADVVGEQLRAVLAENGVGTGKLLRHPCIGTGTSVITLTPRGERSVIFVNGANACFDLSAVPDHWLDDLRVLYVGSIFVLPQFSGEAVGALCARARARGITTVLNICWDAEGRGLSFLEPALRETDYFILNYDEGQLLTSEKQPERIIERLEACTAGSVVVTLGEQGCCLRQAGRWHHIPARPVQATDCTGAGDSFTAGFIAGLILGWSPVACAHLGCYLASLAVTGPGVYTRIPSFEQIRGALQGVLDKSDH
uniref:Sugar kinase n=1 Tax=Thermogemmatispora argillosa TaxID=2045280 RepID=A0A455SYQ5_9CHLR|nr:sugar kinase [Thermogemmatispora argillosa]